MKTKEIASTINNNVNALKQFDKNPTTKHVIEFAKTQGFTISESEASEVLELLEIPLDLSDLEDVAGGRRLGGRTSFNKETRWKKDN